MLIRLATVSMKLALVVVFSVVAVFVAVGKLVPREPEPRVRGAS